MKHFVIKPLVPHLIPGVSVQMPDTGTVENKGYFTWEGNTLTATIQDTQLPGGIIRAQCAPPVFDQMEWHKDAEMFYFISGVSIMPFADMKDDKILMDSIQIVSILPGTKIVIAAGKAHYVPVAANHVPVEIIVAAPPMEAIPVQLQENVAAI